MIPIFVEHDYTKSPIGAVILEDEKMLVRFNDDTKITKDAVFNIFNCGFRVLKVENGYIKEAEILHFNIDSKVLEFKCPYNSILFKNRQDTRKTMICNQPYACDACPYNEDLKR
jgi:hypothetical protein